MAARGQCKILEQKYARLQLLTAEEILEGKRFDIPSVVGKTAIISILLMFYERRRANAKFSSQKMLKIFFI